MYLYMYIRTSLNRKRSNDQNDDVNSNSGEESKLKGGFSTSWGPLGYKRMNHPLAIMVCACACMHIHIRTCIHVRIHVCTLYTSKKCPVHYAHVYM